ncbi:MAG: HAD family hydrolase [Microgenomates group bacterium]
MIERFELKDPFVQQVVKKIEKLGVAGVLLDLDDHFLKTTEFMHRHLGIFVERMAEQTGQDYLSLWEMMKRHSDAAWGLYHVSPVRWQYVVEQMSWELEQPESLFQEAHRELLGMYDQSPEMIPGGLTVLRLMKETLGLKVIWVTNANVNWTIAKFDQHNLWRYTDNLVIADENGHKGVRDWWAGVTLSGLPPEMLLGGGDSIEGDFIPLKQIGVRGIIGVPPQFEQASNGHRPNGVTMIPSIGYWGEGVLKLC